MGCCGKPTIYTGILSLTPFAPFSHKGGWLYMGILFLCYFIYMHGYKQILRRHGLLKLRGGSVPPPYPPSIGPEISASEMRWRIRQNDIARARAELENLAQRIYRLQLLREDRQRDIDDDRREGIEVDAEDIEALRHLDGAIRRYSVQYFELRTTFEDQYGEEF